MDKGSLLVEENVTPLKASEFWQNFKIKRKIDEKIKLDLLSFENMFKFFYQSFRYGFLIFITSLKNDIVKKTCHIPFPEITGNFLNNGKFRKLLKYISKENYERIISKYMLF
jgi:hypothetical protein